jgi:hypothetical protein
MVPVNRTGFAIAAIAGAAFIAACSESPTTPKNVLAAPPPPGVYPRTLEVCKEGPAGTYNFTVSTTGGSTYNTPSGAAFSLTPGQCVVVFVSTAASDVTVDPLATVTVTELGAAPLDSIIVNSEFDGSSKVTGTRVASSTANRFHGGVITYYNAFPPPAGGEGCTPGYWKQSQHFGNWPAGYVPTGAGATDFDAALGVDAFTPNMTLLQALGLSGGGIKALARHAAAALLNAASDAVDYGMTVDEVKALVQSAIVSGDYASAQTRLAALNESGCSLSRAE